MFGSYFSWGFFGIGLMALAIYHFVRRQPQTYWLYIILFLGPLGALAYLLIEALPELQDPGTMKFFERGRRIRELQAEVRENPSAGNYEELGQLFLDKSDWQKARECFDRALGQRVDSVDPFYRRAVAEVQLGDYAAARKDLEAVIEREPAYDFQRAPGLLALCLWKTGDTATAERLFEHVLRTSTLTETQLNYAEFLEAQGRRDDAKEWTRRIRDKRASMPGFLRRRERKLYRRVNALSRRLA